MGSSLPLLIAGGLKLSIETVKAYFRAFGMEGRVIQTENSSATVELAAQVLGVESGRIAKSISLKVGDGCILIVTAGNTKIDNSKYKEQFHTKARMLSPEETLEYIGHAVGGVCPFAIKEGVDVYLDNSLKEYATVFPACGSSNSMIELSIEELEKYSKFKAWVDVCKPKET